MVSYAILYSREREREKVGSRRLEVEGEKGGGWGAINGKAKKMLS